MDHCPCLYLCSRPRHLGPGSSFWTRGRCNERAAPNLGVRSQRSPRSQAVHQSSPNSPQAAAHLPVHFSARSQGLGRAGGAQSVQRGGKDSPAASDRAAPSLSGSGWSSVYPRRSRWGRRIQPGLFVGEGAMSCGAEATATPRSSIRDWTTAKVVRPAVLYTGLAPGAAGESR
ncbi:hypothetical protein NDU88_006167 [Pleurodeles waltl]|uniref:Uncharacterized protein n=1 Tax=Pleurodeles waltl TaxID=8319 RepID=A0AAV7LW53_PLEWA|nr:hypothetical protein NDU88_006167 [Pleurodeles waltl]